MNATVIRTFQERRGIIVELEEWLLCVQSLALKELAGEALEVRETPKPKVIEIILSDKNALWRAKESKRIEEESFARVREQGVSPSEAWAERFALPW
jgi:hypothetical protein